MLSRAVNGAIRIFVVKPHECVESFLQAERVASDQARKIRPQLVKEAGKLRLREAFENLDSGKNGATGKTRGAQQRLHAYMIKDIITH